jgi:hypothetical protein
VQDTDDASGLSFPDERPRIVFCVARVNDDWALHLARERNLSGKRESLGWSRRIVVVIIESALPDRDRRALEKLAKSRDVTLRVEGMGVVRMDSGCREYKARIPGGVFGGERSYLKRLSDADDSCRARIAGAGDYRVAVAGERSVREVGVAVDEDRRASVLRGHLRSIQRSTGPAT